MLVVEWNMEREEEKKKIRKDELEQKRQKNRCVP